ncbi:hypothetical protein BGZ68_003865, partial [Mortierella alpina]
IEADLAGQSSSGRATAKGLSFEALLEELVFSKELEEYFKLVDQDGASKTPKTRAQQREDEVAHAQLLTKHAGLAENSKCQYLTALRLYKTFCDVKYSISETNEDLVDKALRYEVTPTKAMVFMEDVMFKRTRPKYFNKNATEDFNGPLSFKEKSRRGRSDLKKKQEALELIEVLSKVAEDTQGRKKLEIPVGYAVLDNARKALRYLADCQQVRL